MLQQKERMFKKRSGVSRHLALFIAVLLVLQLLPLYLTSSAAAPYNGTPLNPIATVAENIEYNPNTRTWDITTESGEKVRVVFYKDDLFRIWMANNGTGDFVDDMPNITESQKWDIGGDEFEEFNIVIKKDFGAAPAVAFSDAEDYCEFTTGTLTLRAYKNPFTFELRKTSNGDIIWKEKEPIYYRSNRNTQILETDANEHFYGGGMQVGHVDHKGRTMVIQRGGWVVDGVPNPAAFYMTTKGYGVLRNTIANGRYDFTSSDVIDTYHSDNRFDAYYIYGPSFEHILDDYTDLTGRPKMLPRWSIGLGDAAAYRQLNDTRDQGGNPSNMQNVGAETSGNYQPQQTPFGGYWHERGTVGVVDDYINDYLNKDTPVSWFLPNDGYRCEYNKYTHPAGGLDVLGKELREYGIRFGLWIGQPSNYTAANYTYGYPPEATGNDRAPYFTKEIEEQVKSGVRVYKVDVAWSSTKSGNKGPMAVYRYLMDKLETNSKTEENPDGERGFIVGVYGWTGIQRYATVWSGDQMGTYDYTAYHVPTFTGAGMSGMPFSFSDAGSIYHDYPGVYVRDLQMKTLMPLNYAMSNWGNRVTASQIEAAWEEAGNTQDAGPNDTDEFPPNGSLRASSDKRPSSEYHFTDDELDINHKYLMLKQQLVPYIYSYIRNSSLTGAPLVRPMVYNYQDDPNTYGDLTKYQYMSGDWLLAAPVIDARDTVRNNIYLPAGRWIDYWTGENYFGPTTISVNAPYETMPMFVRAGAIVPMSQEFLYDGQEYYTNKAGKTIEVKDTLILDLYPEGSTSFDLYEDDGYTLKFETKDEYTYTTITSEAPAEGSGPLTVTVGPAEGKAFEGQVSARKNMLMIHTQTVPGAVRLGGEDGDVLPRYNSKEALEDMDKELGGWFYDSGNGGILYVRTPSMPTDSPAVVWVDTYTVPASLGGRIVGSLPVPQDVKASALTHKEIEVKWEPVSGASYYEIEIDGDENNIVSSSVPSLRHTNIQAEVSHTYRVRALNATGESIWSEPVRATASPLRVQVPKDTTGGKEKMSAVFTQSGPNKETAVLAASGSSAADRAVDGTETLGSGNRFATAVVNGDIYGGWKPNLDINLGGVFLINSFDYAPNSGRTTGTVEEFGLFTSLDGETWTPVTVLDEYGNVTSENGIGYWRDQADNLWTTSFKPVVARYVRMQQQTSVNNRFSTSMTGRQVWIYQAGSHNIDGGPVTGIALEQSAAELDIGDTMALSATVSPLDALNPNVVFSSSNEMVAKVHPQTGLVTAMGGGTAVITAASQADPGIAAVCAVTVTGIPMTSLVIDGAEVVYATVGEGFQLTAARAPSDATDKVSWSSSEGESVMVSSDGFITILQYTADPVTITAKAESAGLTDSITVQPVKISSLEVDNAAGTLTATFTQLPTSLREDGFRAACDIGLGQQPLEITGADIVGSAVSFAYTPLTQAIDRGTAGITLWYSDGIAVSAEVVGLDQVCAVIFDGNGADADAIPGMVTVKAGQTISLPLPPAKNGYAFTGWYTAKGSTGTQFDPAQPIAESATLYAHWSEKAYTVKFDWGTGEYTNLPFAFDSLITPPEPIDRSGYRLTGWFKNVELTIPWNFETDILKSDTTLYALWTPEYTVSFDTEGGSPVADIEHLLQGSLILAPDAPVKDGYVFTGWYKDAALTAPWNFNADTVAADITLYASWSVAGTAKITLETTGGEAMASIERPVGGVIGDIGDPVRLGDIFQGWYSDEALTIPWDLQNYLIPGDMTLYAKWTDLGDMVFYYPFNDESELEVTQEPYAPVALSGVTLDESDGAGTGKGALKFEDNGAYMRVDGNSFPYGTGETFTFSLWIKPDTVDRQQNLFAASPSGDRANDWLVLRTLPIPGSDELGGYLGQSNLGDSTTAEGTFNIFGGANVKPIKAGEWTQITVVVEIDRIKYYINGEQIGQTNTARWYGSAADYFSLGGRSGEVNTTDCFSGLMDEVRFYDFALSAQQVYLLHEYYQDSEQPPVITSVEVSTPSIVETLAANLRINVIGENLEGKTLTAYLSVDGELLYPTDITSGTALMKVAKAPVVGADCKVVIKVDGSDVQNSFAITLIAYNPETLWKPSLITDEDGFIAVLFAEDIAPTPKGGYSVKVNETACGFRQDGRMIVTDILRKDAAPEVTVVLSGVMYPVLFPSYSFTFTVRS